MKNKNTFYLGLIASNICAVIFIWFSVRPGLFGTFHWHVGIKCAYIFLFVTAVLPIIFWLISTFKDGKVINLLSRIFSIFFMSLWIITYIALMILPRLKIDNTGLNLLTHKDPLPATKTNIMPNSNKNITKIKINTTSMDKNPKSIPYKNNLTNTKNITNKNNLTNTKNIPYKNNLSNTKNMTYKNNLTNTKNAKENNNSQRILSIDRTPKNVKFQNIIVNTTNIKNNKINTEQKTLTKVKTSISKLPTSKDIKTKNIEIPKIDINKKRRIISSNTEVELKERTPKTENKKEDKDKNIIYNKKIINNFVSKKSKEKAEEIIDKKKLFSYTTFEKIVIVQNLLKEMTSIKERFEGNKEKMIEKIYFNCYNYFNDKVYIKEIFDYCITRKPEEHRDYQLISNILDYLDNNMYKSLYDFFFLIRNNNNLMLEIITLSDKFVYEELSDFIVNFFYENIINSSFAQEEVLLMIYLLLENLFFKKMPNNEDLDNNNIYSTYINNSFLFYVFKALTRKIDIRNFLSSILNDIILRMESFRFPLSLDINIVNRFLRIRSTNIHHSFIKFAKGDSENMKIIKTKKQIKKIYKFQSNIPYNQGTEGGGSAFLKRAQKIDLGSSNKLEDSWLIIHSKLSQSRTLNDSILNKSINDEGNSNILNKSRTNININEENLNNDKKDNKENIENIENKENIKNIKNNEDLISHEISGNLKIEELKQEKQEIEIDPFFENNSVTLKFLNDKFLNLRKSLNKYIINNAMKEYIKSLINQLESGEKISIIKKNSYLNIDYMNKESNANIYEKVENTNINNDKEIYSTSLIIDELKSIREIKEEASFKELMRKIKINHRIVTKLILNIIDKVKDNLIYVPIILKYISKILNILLEKKYFSSRKNKLSYYNLYIFKINFLIGNILLPIISNPEFNGIITTDIISQITNDNLKIISDIFKKMLSGELFTKYEDPYMTLFNPFIIETMPKLFELVENAENLKLPEKIRKLIDEPNKTNNNFDRNINYEFFKENKNENIEYQSICFSWQTIYIFLQIVIKYKKLFIDENANNEQKKIFGKFFEYKDKFINFFTNGIKNKKNEFFIITKINYKDEFEKKLNSIISDNFNTIKPKLHNDLITAYKKCLSEVLCYVNIFHKENLLPFTFRKDEVIYDTEIYKIVTKYKKKKNYENIMNNATFLKNKANISNNYIMEINLKKMPLNMGSQKEKDDADFKHAIFPQILDNIKYEISFNLDNPISQRIIFCCNYLKLYMKNIPNEYKINNFSLLFRELIQETQNNIKFLKNNILFEYYLKLKEVEKSNLLLSNYNSQIRNLEKIKCIEYLYNKLALPIKLNITKNKDGIITNIEYINEQKKKENNEDDLNESINIMDYLENRSQPIKNFIDAFPDFHEYEDEFDNILDIEEKSNAAEAINNYFKSLKKILKKEKIVNRFNKDELESIIYDLENYILTKLYDKLFPSESTKDDIFFYKKCARLSFIKPENIVPDKKLINERLIEKAIEHFNDIDDKLTPVDKIKSLAKAIEIVTNSITFSSGKDELGVDDTIKPLMYFIIKSIPKNICSNFHYCELYLNSELGKKSYGVVLSQIGLIIEIIKKLKYNDLIGVSEKSFGIDEIEDEDEEEKN